MVIIEKGQKCRFDSYGDLKKKSEVCTFEFFPAVVVCRIKKRTNGYLIHKNVKNLRYICRIKRTQRRLKS